MNMSTDMLEGLSVSINTFLIVKCKIEKIIFKCRNLHFFYEDGAPWTLLPIMRHHGHVHGALKHAHCTPFMVPRYDDCYKCSFN